MKNARHPYEHLEGQALWRVVDKAVRALAKNGDIEPRTARTHVVGYVCKALADAGFQQVSELKTGDKTLRVVEVNARQTLRAG